MRHDAVPAVELPAQLPIQLDFSPDLHVLGFALIVSRVTAIVFGLLPALQASRFTPASSLKAATGVGLEIGRGRLRRAFVASRDHIESFGETVARYPDPPAWMQALLDAMRANPGAVIDYQTVEIVPLACRERGLLLRLPHDRRLGRSAGGRAQSDGDRTARPGARRHR